MLNSSETTQVQTNKQSSESDNKGLDPVLARKPVVTIEINGGPCRHHAKGFCKRRDACLFSHTQENCPNHGYDKVCQDKACLLRHPEVCKHFLKARCFFGDRCHLFHPTEASPLLVHSMVTSLQAKVADMEKFAEEQKHKPPDTREIAKAVKLEMKIMCKSILEISKNDIAKVAEEIRVDLNNTKKALASYNDDSTRVAREITLDLKAMDINIKGMNAIKNTNTAVLSVIQRDTKAAFSKLSDMQADNQMKFNNMRKEYKQNFIGKHDIAEIIKDMKYDIKRALEAAEDESTRVAEDNKEALEDSVDDIRKLFKDMKHETKEALKATNNEFTRVAKEIRFDLKEMYGTFTTKDATDKCIEDELSGFVHNNPGSDKEDARAHIVIMARNDFAYVDQFLTAVESTGIGCWSVILNNVGQSYVCSKRGYITGINQKEQLICHTHANTKVHGSQKIVIFQSIKKPHKK